MQLQLYSVFRIGNATNDISWESYQENVLKMVLSHRPITAFFVGLKSRIAAFAVQRTINEYREEPLLAILPGVALPNLSLLARRRHDHQAVSKESRL